MSLVTTQDVARSRTVASHDRTEPATTVWVSVAPSMAEPAYGGCIVCDALKVALRKAVAWQLIDRVLCEISLLRIPKGSAAFHEFADYERLVKMAKADGWVTQLIVRLGGEAGLRCGEMMALEWSDVHLGKRLISVARSEWKGHVTSTRGGRVRHVPGRLRDALKQARHLKSARVLCDAEGQPLTQTEVQVAVRRVALRAEVKPGAQVLRHTFCSHLAMKGAPARFGYWMTRRRERVEK
jgi:integrase